jgi:hypothetical protein
MKIQFFDPYANIWPHSFPVLLVAESFAASGHEVSVIRCNGLYSSHCVAMSEARVTFSDSFLKKEIVCRACRSRSKILKGSPEIETTILDSYVHFEDYRVVDEILKKCDQENWLDLSFHGISVGKIASYEIFLAHKVTSPVIKDSIWPEFIANLSNVLITVIAAERQLMEQKPDRVLVYNSLYSVNNSYIRVAENLGIPYYTLQGGPHIVRRPTSLTAFTSPKELLEVSRTNEIKEWLSRPLDSNEISIVSEHLLALFEGKSAFAYSSAADRDSLKSIPKVLDFDPDSKVFLALTSSEDELFATELVGEIPNMDNQINVFPSQSDWLKWLIEYFTENPHFTLIIRVHPRLAPNKRESVMAPYYFELLDIFTNLPPNVKINWPKQNISLYDLLQFVDVGLNKRSSAGVELLTFGIPVILAGDYELFSYPRSIGLFAADKWSYKKLISEAASDGWSLENVRIGFRWLSFLFSATTIDLMPKSIRQVTKLQPSKNPFFLRAWKHLTFIFLQLGPKSFEKKVFANRELSNPAILSLIEAVIQNKNGISGVKVAKPIANFDLNLENELLISDLKFRMSKPINAGHIATKLSKMIDLLVQ